MPVTKPSLSDLRRGDTRAWDDAVRWLWPVAIRSARGTLGGAAPEEAEDVAAEAVAAMVGQVAKIESVEDLRPILASIAHRRAVDVLRKKKSEKRKAEKIHPLTSDCVEEEALRRPLDMRELADLIDALGARLRPQQLSVLKAFFIEELSYREISDRQGIPMGTVATHIRRGLSDLRRILERNPKLLKEMGAFLR